VCPTTSSPTTAATSYPTNFRNSQRS
jgi:hypothetical protein